MACCNTCTCTVEYQNWDYSVDELGEFDLSGCKDVVASYDWMALAREFEDRLNKGKKDFSPPHMILRREQGEAFVSLSMQARDEFDVMVEYPVRGKFLGFIPTIKYEGCAAERVRVADFPCIIDRFFMTSTNQLDQVLDGIGDPCG
jgi:hypothetical protein